MPKPELAFHSPSGLWSPIAGVAGLEEMILALDEPTGDSPAEAG
jgi:hypothetical protein